MRAAWKSALWTFVVIIAVGVAVPLFIPSYPPGSDGEELTFARYAQAQVAVMLDHPIQHALVWQYQVKDVKTLDTSGTCGDVPYVARGRYSATVIARTWMGIRLATVTVGCRGASLK